MAEKEYIEREALLKEIGRRKSIARTSFPKQNFCVNDVLHCIYDATTADVVEVRHGEWVHNRDTGDERCTVCGFEWWDFCQECGVRPSNTKYCPNCGAKMDGKGGSNV